MHVARSKARRSNGSASRGPGWFPRFELRARGARDAVLIVAREPLLACDRRARSACTPRVRHAGDATGRDPDAGEARHPDRDTRSSHRIRRGDSSSADCWRTTIPRSSGSPSSSDRQDTTTRSFSTELTPGAAHAAFCRLSTGSGRRRRSDDGRPVRPDDRYARGPRHRHGGKAQVRVHDRRRSRW
jgi:hypothetical protein